MTIFGPRFASTTCRCLSMHIFLLNLQFSFVCFILNCVSLAEQAWAAVWTINTIVRLVQSYNNACKANKYISSTMHAKPNFLKLCGNQSLELGSVLTLHPHQIESIAHSAFFRGTHSLTHSLTKLQN